MGTGTVTVFGAYGHTGRFAVAELLERGFVPVLAGRDGRQTTRAGDPEVVLPEPMGTTRRGGRSPDPHRQDQPVGVASAGEIFDALGFMEGLSPHIVVELDHQTEPAVS
ncbi:hypothetical protein AB0B45_48325 [Nonomuraea sp. NPDC049152]|uniref:hypothetical protein n=1 Tax=Nonomuraea sp. NPDC049152 TaxID=3154350 RepID=UPI0033C29B3E